MIQLPLSLFSLFSLHACARYAKKNVQRYDFFLNPANKSVRSSINLNFNRICYDCLVLVSFVMFYNVF